LSRAIQPSVAADTLFVKWSVEGYARRWRTASIRPRSGSSQITSATPGPERDSPSISFCETGAAVELGMRVWMPGNGQECLVTRQIATAVAQL